MHLINPNAPYFRGSDLLLAADCVAFSMDGLLQIVSAALVNASRKVPVKKMVVEINGEVLQEELV